jgi:S-adenosylhomocysteine hydrolase
MSTADTSWGAEQAFCAEWDEVTPLVDALISRLKPLGWALDGRLEVSGDSETISFSAAHPDSGQLYGIVRPAPRGRMHLPNERSLVAIATSTSPEGSAALDRWLERLPFTDTELNRIRGEMPLTSEFLQHLPRWIPGAEKLGTRPLSGFGGIFTIHHQTDFLVLLEQALALGINPNLVTVIDKQYRYEASSRVDATITDRLKVPVYTYDQLLAGLALSDHIRRVKGDMESASAPVWSRTIIVDDGGYVLPRLTEYFEAYMPLFVGVVEQTASGIWALKPYEADLKVPVFSVAESDLKQTVEAHGVAMAAVVNLRNLLPNVKFTGQRAVVVGYGRIGKAVSEVLRSMRLRVMVVDPDRGARVSAHEDGFDTARTVVDAIRMAQPQFVIACAGKSCVDGPALQALRGRTYLASCTSRDYAFDKQYLAEHYEPQPYGSIGTVYRDDDRSELFLVADGYPVNFHFAESMPNAQSDLVMASMLLGAVHLCTAEPAWPAGNDSARANFHLNAGTLLDDFYDLHHEVIP